MFPAHRTTGGLVLLAALDPEAVRSLYPAEDYAERPEERPDLVRLGRELARVRKSGFDVNNERSERGIVAVGVPVQGGDGVPVAGLSVSFPSVRLRPAPAARARGGAAAGSRCGRGGTRRLTLRGQWPSGRALPPPAPRMRRSPRPAEQDEGSEPESGVTQMS